MSPRSLGEGRLLWPLERPPTRALIDALRAIEGVLDVAASEQDVLGALRDPRAPAVIARVERALREPIDSAQDEGALHTVELVYDGADLDEIAARAGLSREAVIEAHAGREYTARATGFAPGWAYLGELDPRIQVARRSTARPRVAAGSVAIADARTGIYPFDMPGGWSVLGTVAGGFRPFDPERGAVIALGDRVRFARVERDERPPRRAASTEPARQGRGLLIEWSEAPALVQDGGRTGVLHLGLARGGALWRALLAHSNASLGQRWSAAALELYGALRVRAVGGAVALSVDGETHVLAQDGSLEIPRSERARVRYLAIEGGVACSEQLGGRGQLLRAALGGLDHARHRPVQRGDVLVCGTDAREARDEREPDERYDRRMLEEDFAIELREGDAGERFEAGAFERFVRGVHRVSAQSDRTGLRMESRVARVDHDTGRSAVMAAGLVQVSADGTPIVLGVDHPTVGGYPVFAQVTLAHLGALLARRPGAMVRYRRPL